MTLPTAAFTTSIPVTNKSSKEPEAVEPQVKSGLKAIRKLAAIQVIAAATTVKQSAHAVQNRADLMPVARNGVGTGTAFVALVDHAVAVAAE